MAHRFISELADGEQVDGVYLAADKQLRTNRTGGRYLLVRLADKTGYLTAMLWNANDKMVEMFDGGDYVRVCGTTQIYNGTLQLIATRIERVPDDQIDENDYIRLTDVQVDRLACRLEQHLRGLDNVHLRALAECFLMDEAFMQRFRQAPAAIKHHHAYPGGLLEHVVTMLDLAAAVAGLYRQLDVDLLKMGVFLHDVGKVDELSYERELGYTDEGQLLGHLVLGVEILQERIGQAEQLSGEKFPAPLVWQLKHMIVSHHGSYEFGSPKVPMTLEALVLHYLDSLDAKLHSFTQILNDEIQGDERWTSYQAALGRKLYKPTNRSGWQSYGQ